MDMSVQKTYSLEYLGTPEHCSNRDSSLLFQPTDISCYSAGMLMGCTPRKPGLSMRLVQRGVQLPTNSDIGRECGPEMPSKLQATEGSTWVHVQKQKFTAAVLRCRTVQELREVCRLTGSCAGGTKEDLIKRLAFGESVDASPQKRRRVSCVPSMAGTDKENGFVELTCEKISMQRRRRMSI